MFYVTCRESNTPEVVHPCRAGRPDEIAEKNSTGGTIVTRVKENPRNAAAARLDIYEYGSPLPKVVERSRGIVMMPNIFSTTWKNLSDAARGHYAEFLNSNE